IRHGLFDEYRIGLVPVTLGVGSPLFKRDSQSLRLDLLDSRPLGDRCLLLRYQPAAVAAAAG
ncbi:MAG: dihydrofolate reductase family protein, partial [Planctomycetaceae bacterium]